MSPLKIVSKFEGKKMTHLLTHTKQSGKTVQRNKRSVIANDISKFREATQFANEAKTAIRANSPSKQHEETAIKRYC